MGTESLLRCYANSNAARRLAGGNTMNQKYTRLRSYIIARMQESSTWRGLTLLIAASGASVSPELKELILILGIGVAGAIAVVFPDKKK